MERIERDYNCVDLKDELEQLVILVESSRNIPMNPMRLFARFSGFKSRAMEIVSKMKLPPAKEVAVMGMIDDLRSSFPPKLLQTRVDIIIAVINNKDLIVDVMELYAARSATMGAVERITAK